MQQYQNQNKEYWVNVYRGSRDLPKIYGQNFNSRGMAKLSAAIKGVVLEYRIHVKMKEVKSLPKNNLDDVRRNMLANKLNWMT